MSNFVRLYKFYAPRWGIESIEKSRLKISTISDLNDPFELRSLSFGNSANYGVWETAREKILKSTGIICFCKAWSNPVIWSHYAANHSGLALGFDVAEKLLLPVQYVKHKKRVPSFSQMPTDRLVPFMKKMLSTKFKHWEYEDEVRIFSDLEERDVETGLYFGDFDENLVLREVVIGALASPETKENVRHAIQNKDVKSRQAALALSEFKIVRQRDT